jgi:hypothetical protein
MKYSEIDKRAMELFKAGHEVKFYEMVLCFAMQNLFVGEDEIELTETQFSDVLSDMVDYLADNFEESPWFVADTIVRIIDKHGVEAFLNDYNNDRQLLDKEMEG